MLSMRQYLVFLVIFSFFLPLGLYPLFDLDEGTFSEATREMLANGNYLTAYLQGQLHFDKPILIYWLQALATQVFGFHEWALRLPSAFATTTWAYILYRFCRFHLNGSKALTATILFVSCLHINLIGKSAICDALLNLCISTTMLSLFHYTHTQDRRYMYLFYISSGVGVLTKGPIALLIPCAVLLIFSLCQNTTKYIRALLNIQGLFLFATIVLPWYLAEYFDHGDAFVQDFFIKHNLGRFLHPLNQQSGFFGYYLPVLLLGTMPFTGLLIQSLRKLPQDINTPLLQYMAIWFGFVFLFFSISSTKLPHYLVYGYTPLFVLMAYYNDGSTAKSWFVIPLALIFTLLISIPFLFSYSLYWIQAPYLLAISEDVLRVFSHSYQLQILLCAFGAIAPWYANEDLSLHQRLLLSGFFFSIAINFIVTPLVASIEQLPIKHAASYVRHNPQTVKEYGFSVPSFSVYSEQIMYPNVPTKGDTVLLRANHLEDFQNYSILFYENGIYLIRLTQD
ncbi:MAG: glycosyltransferase family 39 protein [Pseudomonadota bacterium]|nr:glycosyltransferase family 39 protein [Pseudomonadota bacterium]